MKTDREGAQLTYSLFKATCKLGQQLNFPDCQRDDQRLFRSFRVSVTDKDSFFIELKFMGYLFIGFLLGHQIF